MTIRAFSLTDIESIAGWWDASSSQPWSLKVIIEAAKKDHYHVLVSEQDSEINGVCLFTLVADECNLLYITVASKNRKQGVAKQLLAALIGQSQQQRISRVFLEVRESNRAAIALYQSNGFSQSGERKNYYSAIKSVSDTLLKNTSSQRETALLFDLLIKKLD